MVDLLVCSSCQDKTEGLPQQLATASVELLDPKTMMWSELPPCPFPVINAKACRFDHHGHSIIMTGGCGGLRDGGGCLVQIFSMLKNTWQSAPPLQQPRHSHSCTLLRQGQIVVAGGK